MTTIEQRTGNAIRPFHMAISAEALDDLRRRLAATRWPGRELVDDRSQGVQLATIQEVARYWMGDYDMRRVEARLNALPQFRTEIDGVDVHFLHVRSPHPDALPLIMTHGWPGSVIELLDSIGPLTDPTAHGATAGDAFHLVVPSIPATGAPGSRPRWAGTPAASAAPGTLMHRLGYDLYVAQGGDLGAYVVDAMGREHPEGLLGIHTNLLVAPPADGSPRHSDTEEEKTALAAIAERTATGLGYFIEQATRPQTIGYPQVDSPIALASWLLDHDTDSYYKISRAFLGGEPSGNLTRDNVLDNITLYWLTATGTSAARAYWETGQAQARGAGHASPPVTVPAAFTTFPGEAFAAPRSWLEQAYPTLSYYNRVDRGGHFAAGEEPELFATEVRAAFRSLR